MKKIELNNRGTILALSIAISVLLWSYVMGDINPQINRNFAGVAVNVIYGEDDELLVTSELDPKVDVRLSGRRNDVYEIRRSDMLFTLDLSDYGEGSHKVDVEDSLNIGTSTVKIDYNPKQVDVEIEKIISKVLPVEMDIAGKLPGGMAEDRIQLKSKDVQVRGPRSAVDRVSRLKVSVNATELAGNELVEADIIAVDSNGEIVSNVELSETTARVELSKDSINIATVEPNVVGEVLDGYELISVEANPRTVELSGSLDLESVKTEEIDINGLSEGKEIEVGLLLPEGVEVLSTRDIVVSLKVKAIEEELEDIEEEQEDDTGDMESKVIDYSTSGLSIVNLDDGFKIENKDELVESLEVLVRGEISLLEGFESSDLLLGMDFSSIAEAGSHQVEILAITVKDGITIESISPQRITIILGEVD